MRRRHAPHHRLAVPAMLAMLVSWTLSACAGDGPDPRATSAPTPDPTSAAQLDATAEAITQAYAAEKQPVRAENLRAWLGEVPVIDEYEARDMAEGRLAWARWMGGGIPFGFTTYGEPPDVGDEELKIEDVIDERTEFWSAGVYSFAYETAFENDGSSSIDVPTLYLVTREGIGFAPSRSELTLAPLDEPDDERFGGSCGKPIPAGHVGRCEWHVPVPGVDLALDVLLLQGDGAFKTGLLIDTNLITGSALVLHDGVDGVDLSEACRRLPEHPLVDAFGEVADVAVSPDGSTFWVSSYYSGVIESRVGTAECVYHGAEQGLETGAGPIRLDREGRPLTVGRRLTPDRRWEKVFSPYSSPDDIMARLLQNPIGRTESGELQVYDRYGDVAWQGMAPVPDLGQHLVGAVDEAGRVWLADHSRQDTFGYIDEDGRWVDQLPALVRASTALDSASVRSGFSFVPNIWQIHIDHPDGVWFRANNGELFFRDATGAWSAKAVTQQGRLVDDLEGQDPAATTSLLARPDGRLWIGTEVGAIRVDPDGTQTNIGLADGLLGVDVRAIDADDGGAIWFATQVSMHGDSRISAISRLAPDGTWRHWWLD